MQLLKSYGLLIGFALLTLGCLYNVILGDTSTGLSVCLMIALFGIWNELRILDNNKPKAKYKKKNK
jgi:hypothetical protein